MMPGDWCTSEGARRLKQKIEAYWRDRGYEVDISLVEAGFMPAMRSARTDVRSDMVNGMPRRVSRDTDRVQARSRSNVDL
jgi:hypothetical protein